VEPEVTRPPGEGSPPDVPPLLGVVREAAADALAGGAADLAVSTVTELYGGGGEFDDYPVVMLTPRNPAAAEVRIEVQDDIRWFSADDGPTLDLYQQFVLKGTFLRGDGPVTTMHFYAADRPDPERVRPFEPY
jgi:hypothetical protein